MTFKFIDNNTNEAISLTCACEDDAWCNLCDTFGTGYVFENIEEIF